MASGDGIETIEMDQATVSNSNPKFISVVNIPYTSDDIRHLSISTDNKCEQQQDDDNKKDDDQHHHHHHHHREKKLGHRRVGEGGEVTYKRIQSSQIMASIQLGIQHTVGSLASKPKRDLLMMDFWEIESISFPPDGSNITPAHRYSEFRFKVYAPIAFRYFRDLFGIQPDDFMMSMCAAPLIELSNPGASGSIFYLTDNDEFIIKTVQHKEGEFLQKLLPGYYMNLNQNPRTLLPKFFGLYCFQCNSKNVRLVVMNNLLPSCVKMHLKYDLKGSTYKRKASKEERSKKSPTYKDLDFMEHYPEGIYLEIETYNALIKTIQRDCTVLESFEIMDYSLLVGVHNLDLALKEREEEKLNMSLEQNYQEEIDLEDAPEADQCMALEERERAGAIALNRSKSINRQRLVAHSTAMESIQVECEPNDDEDDVPPGGIPAKNEKGEKLLLFLGIIDILQSYRLKKKLEHTFKSIFHDGDTISVCRPSFYAQRFQNFMAKTVFKKLPPQLKHSPSKRRSLSRAQQKSFETEFINYPVAGTSRQYQYYNIDINNTPRQLNETPSCSSTPPPGIDDISEENYSRSTDDKIENMTTQIQLDEGKSYNDQLNYKEDAMSLKRKDPTAPGGLRVAANDPHLVSLGGGRLSTAVTIHYIPIGNMTIGSSAQCSISLNGSGVQSLHCTLNRTEDGEVTIMPESEDARVLIDSNRITQETNLTQGAMLTIGKSNYLRFNNPAEAEMIKSTMGSNERISMPQIDFAQQDENSVQQQNNTDDMKICNKSGLLNNALMNLSKSYDKSLNNETTTILEKVAKIEYININNFHSPKVFTADSITVNAPAKDVLGPKYASFAKNLATNHKNDKNYCTKNNEMNFNHQQQQNNTNISFNSNNSNRSGNYVNIPPPQPSNFIQNSSTSSTNSIPNKKTNNIPPSYFFDTQSSSLSSSTIVSNGIRNQQMVSAAYDRYPKLGGGLQLFPMNGVNSEINISKHDDIDNEQKAQIKSPVSTNRNNNSLESYRSGVFNNSENMSGKQQKIITAQEQERLDEILKICVEYQQQNQNTSNIQSSPIVQNRIKTNGSLPRDKKSPFFDSSVNSQQSSSKTFFPTGSTTSTSPIVNNITVGTSTTSDKIAKSNSNSGYENVRLIGDRRIEIGSPNLHNKNSSGYENVIIGKYIPQSPRTKIRTTCTSPQNAKKDISYSSLNQYQHNRINNYHQGNSNNNNNNNNNSHNFSQSTDYAQLIQTFEDKLKLEMQAIQECTKAKEKQAISQAKVVSSTLISNGNDSLRKRQNLNINNLTLNLNSNNNHNSSNQIEENTNNQNIVNNNNSNQTKSFDNLHKTRENVLTKIRKLKTQIADIQRQEDEVLRELDLEKALVTAEMSTVNVTLVEMEKNFKSLQSKIHRLEAQRNANRVMQETQQAKLKQAIEVKQEQVSALKTMLTNNETNEVLKEEYEKSLESLENDRKMFEDLEFQYLEEETDWLAYREELHTDLKNLSKEIEEHRLQMYNLRSQGIENQNSACTDTKTLENNLLTLLTELERSREELQLIDKTILNITGDQNNSEIEQKNQTQQNQSQQQNQSDSDEDEINELRRNSKSNLINDSNSNDNVGGLNKIMSQSLFGSTEILSTKPKEKNDLMSRSVNENMFYNNNKIEMPSSLSSVNSNCPSTSTPKKELKVFEIKEELNSSKNKMEIKKGQDIKNEYEIIPEIVRREHNNDESDPILKLKYNVKVQNNKDDESTDNDNDFNENNDISKVNNLNLSLESDDFEVNPLDKRIPSQDDIDRICKVTLDAPISTTKGASSKIIESIKEIERNRQLLLAQQGSHVIEHERQKMMELKKKCHDEAKAQYLSSQSNITQQQSYSDSNKPKANYTSDGNKEENENKNENSNTTTTTPLIKLYNQYTKDLELNSSQQRHSHPELESQNSRTFSNTNSSSDINCENFKEKHFKSNNDLTLSTLAITTSAGETSSSSQPSCIQHQGLINRFSLDNSDYGDIKRSSLNSNNTLLDNDDGNDEYNNHSIDKKQYYHNYHSNNNKRSLPKHQRPLTRYLPIMSPDLDLKQHIESAGHQISLCPHVIIDSYSCRGYLHKLGATFHGWSRRWFVLDRQKCAFIYYSDRSERKPRGGAYFSTIDEVYLDHLNTSKSGRPHCTFIVKTKRRSYHLQAASDAAARIWIDAIITGAQGNIDY